MTHEPSSISAASAATAGGGRVRVALGLQPVWRAARAAGPAFTVDGVAGDNLALHHALASAPTGSVIVASLAGDRSAGHWGELMCVAAQAAGISGLVIDGAVRDLVETQQREFPVFCDGSCPAPATKRELGRLGVPIAVRGASVEPGDFVIADADGVVVIPASHIEDVVREAVDLDRREAALVTALAAGRTTIEELGLPGPTT